MTPSRRSIMTHNHRGLSLVTEQMPIDTSDLNAVNYSAAAYVLQNQNAGTHHGTQSNNVMPDERAIRSSEINRASCFQPASQAMVIRHTGPSRVDYAPPAKDGLLGLLDEGACPEIFQLPELEPLTSAEESDMLLYLLTHEQRESMENSNYLSSSQQLNQTTPFKSFLSSQPCAVQHPPLNSTIVTPVVTADILQAAPTANITLFPMVEEPTTFDVQIVQSPANNASPTSDPDRDRSTNSAVPNHARGEVEGVAATSNRSARRVANTTGGRRRHHAVPAPTTTAGTTAFGRARRNHADVILSKVESQRQNHIRSERQRRTTMNEMFSSMRSLLPPQTQSDKASLVMEMINYIGRLQNELARLERLKRTEGIEAAPESSDLQCTATGSDHNDAIPARGIESVGDPGLYLRRSHE